MTLIRFLLVFLLLAGPSRALEDCDFNFEIDTQTSALQALIEGASSRGGFWRPIREAPDDVQALGRFIGRLDICLITPDGKPRSVRTGNGIITLQSPHVSSCTAALLPGNRLLTNRHCFFEPSLVAAGFTRVREARINFGYVSRDFTGNVQTFLVDDRELADDRDTDGLLLQIIGGDANGALGGHVPLVMETDAKPRRALTMIHHPRGAPQQFSSGTCQVHPQQADLPEGASQLRHSCESAGGSSGSLLLDARSLAVVGLHNQGGLNGEGGYNAGHKIEAVAAALGLDFAPAPRRGGPARDPETQAMTALTEALSTAQPNARRAALEAVIAGFPGTRAAAAAQTSLALMTAPAPDPEIAAGRALIAAMEIDDDTLRERALRGVRSQFSGTRSAALALRQLANLRAERAKPDPTSPAGAAPKLKPTENAAPKKPVAMRGKLGVRIQNISEDMAKSLGRDDTLGALVTELVEGGSAERGGIKAGDMILKLDDLEVQSVDTIVQRVGAVTRASGARLAVTLLRDGKTRVLNVVLDVVPIDETPTEAKPAAAPETAAKPAQKAKPSPAGAQSLEALGMGLSFIPEGDKGPKGKAAFRVDHVADDSEAAGKDVRPGDYIVEILQREVSRIEDFEARLDAQRAEGRKSVLFLMYRNGGPRFVALSIR